MPDKLALLVKKAGMESMDFEKKFVAVKIHFGELGNLAYIRPNYGARLVDMVKRLGGIPFYTDANTLYHGARRNAVDHIHCAMENGYNPISGHAPVIIADGVKGTEYREVPVPHGEYCKSAKIGSAVADADIVISMNHFKGHEQSSFGGALKNLGMGCASIGGKLFLHSNSKPRIEKSLCISCGICVKNCAHKAIKLGQDKKAEIDYDLCVGCGQCVALCQYDSAQNDGWNSSGDLNNRIAEYAWAVLDGKQNFHINFIMNVSPDCDCWSFNDVAIIPDIGIAASFDPVALDQACADMVTAAPVQSGSVLHRKPAYESLAGEDKFTLLHPRSNWSAGLDHAQKIGAGERKYELVNV